MHFDDLLRARVIERAEAPPEQIAELLAVARRDLRTAEHMLSVDLDWAFAIAYNCILQLSVAYMNFLGFRPFAQDRARVMRAVEGPNRRMSRFASTLALAVLSPLLALLTLAIRLDSRGPVFYRQTRVGLEGRPFRIFKFRTMIPEANPRNSWPWVAATGAPR